MKNYQAREKYRARERVPPAPRFFSRPINISLTSGYHAGYFGDKCFSTEVNFLNPIINIPLQTFIFAQ